MPKNQSKLRKSIRIILAAIVFVASLPLYENLNQFIWAGAGVTFLFIFVNLVLIRKTARTETDYLPLILPTIYLVGFFGTVASLSSLGMRLFLALGAVFLFYVYQIYFPTVPPLLVEETVSLAAGFMALLTVWSVNFFFTPAWWLLSSLTLIVFFPMFFQAFYKMGRAGLDCILLSLIASLIMVETAWAILFMPVYFLTAAVVNFSAFYLIYVLSGMYFAGRLTAKKVYFQTGLILLFLLISFISSPWKPL
ncbi:MAG: hypothetical protein U1C57_00155 [Candidatus Doudnabacteria bacterium]|nr:hypothetical protein [bacterium]MDZ4243502.1 hypothetical protein [Candidatus Doudnabacteria bacterium]